jgi:hypothetical protein
MLFKHLLKIDGISVHVFKNLEDLQWQLYLKAKKVRSHESQALYSSLMHTSQCSSWLTTAALMTTLRS